METTKQLGIVRRAATGEVDLGFSYSGAYDDKWSIAFHAKELQRVHERLARNDMHGPVRVIYSKKEQS